MVAILDYQIKEAMQLRLTLSEFALQISEKSEKSEHDFIDMKEQADAENSQKALSESIQALEDTIEESK